MASDLIEMFAAVFCVSNLTGSVTDVQ